MEDLSRLSLHLEDGTTSYPPGAQLIATAQWELDRPVDSIKLRLLWYTRGKGESDSDVVQEITFDNPGSQGQKRLGIQLPDSPYSFSGKLISLIWVLELEAIPSGDTERVEIILAPDGKEIVLSQLPSEDDLSRDHEAEHGNSSEPPMRHESPG